MYEHLGKLEGYLRVADVPARAWSAILTHLTDNAGIAITATSPDSPRGGDIACLSLPEGRICYLKTPGALQVKGVKNDSLSVLVLLRGDGAVGHQGGRPVAENGAVALLPGQSIQLTCSAGAEVVLLQITGGPAKHITAAPGEQAAKAVSSIVKAYLARSVFFHNHQHALQISSRVIRFVSEQLGGTPDTGLEGLAPELGARVSRALKLIETDDWHYSLQELAGAAGASERNLYYMMKRQIGMTPYLVFQRHRLLQVRRDIVSATSGRAQIGPLANRAGFMHLGRFAALYRKHFGELPSETVAECARLRALAGTGESASAAAQSSS